MRGLNLLNIFKLLLLILAIYILVLLPAAVAFKYGVLPLFSQGFGFFLLALVLCLADFWLLLLSAVVIPGLGWRVLRIGYSGSHPLLFSEKDVRNWIFSLVIYLPAAVILDFFHLYPLKNLQVRLFGAKVGKSVVMGGLVLDPCLLEVGDNTVIGGFSTIAGHAVERGKIFFNKVRIGRNCGVGIRAVILPGACLEDGSMLGAQSLLPKMSVIPAHQTYGGVPARKLDYPPQFDLEKEL
ncbi:MAG: hypothetical protein ACE5GI_03230 [Candidatus Aminicenantales bacterium]